MNETIECQRCGYEYDSDSQGSSCPFCSNQLEGWELRFSPIPQLGVREQIAGWLSQLTHPCFIDLVATKSGVRLRLYTPPGEAIDAVDSWAAMTRQQTRWVRVTDPPAQNHYPLHVLQTYEILPTLSASMHGDPFLAIASQLKKGAGEHESGLRIWILKKDDIIQERLRSLSAYAYGTESGIGNNAPNPWALRLGFIRFFTILGLLITAVPAGLTAIGKIPPPIGVMWMVLGFILIVISFAAQNIWMKWRSVPKDVLDKRLEDTLFKVSCTLRAPSKSLEKINLLTGRVKWVAVESEWPHVQTRVFPLPAVEVAALISPPEQGDVSGVIDREVIQDIPAPPPSPALVNAPFKIGTSSVTGEKVGVNPDGHGLIAGGTRTGKSSATYQLLTQLIEMGDDAPGIFLVDPHLSLSDSFLMAVDSLPDDLRKIAIKRLRVVSPDQPEMIPLNLMTVPDFSWAGNALIQLGTRLWDKYWGPRMQAAISALFKLGHVWNSNMDEKVGLLHIVFGAFSRDWRHDTMAFQTPYERSLPMMLDNLLGQMAVGGGSWKQSWATEVASPVISKVMALELSDWLFGSLHQDRFVDMERWIKEKTWIVLRLPTGPMGREGARIMASVVYNVFEAAYRRVTQGNPIPFYFVIDEVQEIGMGMQLETLLSEGAKFGARLFILSQSLSMMRQIPGFEPVVQSLLANTSTQLFFSPDPEDAELIKKTMSLDERYGPTTLDLESRLCWMRARIDDRWEPPTLVKVDFPPAVDDEVVKGVIREVIQAHRDDYVNPADWRERVVDALRQIVPPEQKGLLDPLLKPKRNYGRGEDHDPDFWNDPERRIGDLTYGRSRG